MASKKKLKSGFSQEEKKAMAERAKEIALTKKMGSKPNVESMEEIVLQKISEMSEPDRTIATNFHALIKNIAPNLTPRTWYGMPAYEKEGSVLCFFQERDKFKTRYATVGFSDKAHLDEGAIWPVTFAVLEWNKEIGERLRELITRAIS